MDYLDDLMTRWRALAMADVTVSICLGPSAGYAIVAWTVLCAHKSGAEFDKPFFANSFQQCIEIAEIEAEKRGWTGTEQP